mmetsp:Transcript_1453/g.3318  ORF Transcript_1453/g.3318 Transcript_1453/m.3318 type:complete len:537 (-) Transcript_1453:88-1698(-)
MRLAGAAAFAAIALAVLGVRVQGREGAPSAQTVAVAAAAEAPAPAPAALAARQNWGPFSVRLHRQLIPLHSDSGGIVHHKSAYYGQISVGGPQGQLFEVVFDTGSGHLVLPSLMCKSDTCRQHRRYKKRDSQFAQDIDVDGTPVSPWQARDQITVSFGTGEVTGVFVRDRVCLGPPPIVAELGEHLATQAASLLQVDKARVHEAGQSATPAEEDNGPEAVAGVAPVATAVPGNAPRHGCMDLRVITATQMTEDPFSSFSFDGVLGLGLSSLSQSPDFNFVSAAALAGAWTGRSPGHEHIFAVFLAVSEDEESEITFGGWRSEHIQDGAELAWCGVRDAQDGYWQLDVREIRVDGKKIDFCDDGSCRGIVDTGTSLLGVPSALGPELIWLLHHAASLPDGSCGEPGPQLEIDLGNVTVVLDPSDYGRPELVDEAGSEEPPSPADGLFDVGQSKGTPAADGEAFAADVGPGDGASGVRRSCVPMLMHIDLPEPLSPKTLILGEPVLQKYYAVFDGVAPRVGLARAQHVRPRTPLLLAV